MFFSKRSILLGQSRSGKRSNKSIDCLNHTYSRWGDSMISIKKLLNALRFMLITPCLDLKDDTINMDIDRWKSVLHLNSDRKQTLSYLLGHYREFRNLYLFRNGNRPFFRRLVRLLYRPLDSLYITTAEIGGGLFIQHGFSTYIAAASIGQNCWINQQVTIGYRDETTAPVIGDNVTITCGAKVLGPITIGDHAVIGANAVVVRDVEPGAVMGGVPARRIK